MALPTQDASPAERRETSRAIRWVAGCSLAIVLLYALIASLVTDDSYITKVGRAKEVHFVLRDVRELDRQAVYGDSPVVWIVGSSIARETFDAAAIEARMAAAGSEFKVAKFAFNRGAPVFTQAIVDDLPIRPGDRVITSIAEGNFRWGWLQEAAAFDLYVQAILAPKEILSLSDVALPNRLEWSLGSTPPAEFYRNQPAFRRGLLKIMGSWFGLSKARVKRNVSYQPFTNTNRSFTGRSSQDWTVPADEVVLGPGQTNYDGLQWLIDDCAQRNVDLTVLYVPGHPLLYERFVATQTVVQLQEHFDGLVGLDYHRLAPRKGRAYQDYKHPNNKGRVAFSNDLADLLLTAEGLTPPAPELDPYRANAGDLPEVLFKRLQP